MTKDNKKKDWRVVFRVVKVNHFLVLILKNFNNLILLFPFDLFLSYYRKASEDSYQAAWCQVVGVEFKSMHIREDVC